MLTHSAKGKVSRVDGQTVVFSPANSSYELHLASENAASIQTGKPIDLLIKGTARKVYSVSTGGLFVTPIIGTPKILQGKVKDIIDGWLTLNCGVLVNVKLPTEAGAIELAGGQIQEGSLVNVVLFPGASCTVKS